MEVKTFLIGLVSLYDSLSVELSFDFYDIILFLL